MFAGVNSFYVIDFHSVINANLRLTDTKETCKASLGSVGSVHGQMFTSISELESNSGFQELFYILSQYFPCSLISSPGPYLKLEGAFVCYIKGSTVGTSLAEHSVG